MTRSVHARRAPTMSLDALYQYTRGVPSETLLSIGFLLFVMWSVLMFRWGRRPNLRKWKHAHRTGIERGEETLRLEREKHTHDLKQAKDRSFQMGEVRGQAKGQVEGIKIGREEGKAEAMAGIKRTVVLFLREQADYLDSQIPTSPESEQQPVTNSKGEDDGVFRIEDE